jgi:hypothetical protein
LVSGWSVVVAVGGGMQWQMGKSPEFAVVALVHALPCVGLGILRECAEHERECECGRAFGVIVIVCVHTFTMVPIVCKASLLRTSAVQRLAYGDVRKSVVGWPRRDACNVR